MLVAEMRGFPCRFCSIYWTRATLLRGWTFLQRPLQRIAVGAIILILIVLSVLPKEAQACNDSLPVLLGIGIGAKAQTHPDGTFPINGTAATLYAKSLIDDYNAIVNDKETSSDIQTYQHFFWLYHAVGASFEVQVLRDNVSLTNGQTNDEIEFLFTPIQASSPNVTVYTNETGRELRFYVAGFNQSAAARLDYRDFCLSHGTGYGRMYSQTPIGASIYSLMWFTNSSSVYNNTLVNSESAAQAIYAIGLQDKNAATFWANAWEYVVAFSVVFGIALGVIYLWREGIWPFHPRATPSGGVRRRRPRRGWR